MKVNEFLKKRKQTIEIIVSLVMVLVLATGIALSMNKEKSEGITVDEFKELAKDYYREKYNEELRIKEVGEIYTDGVVSIKTNNMYIKAEDGTTVIYIEEKNEFYDNKQTEEITNNIEETVLKQVCEKLVNDTEAEEVFYESLKLNEFNIFTKQDISGSYYNSLFNGDIKEFLENEEVIFNDLRLFVICNDDDSVEDIKNVIIAELKNVNLKYEESNIEASVLTKECYEKYLNSEFRLPDIDMLGCYAKFRLGKSEYDYLQNYIEVATGIYITSAEKDFLLEEGDIVLEKCESEKLALYQMKFSDRVKSFIENKTYNELNIYVRYDLEEVQFTKESVTDEDLEKVEIENIKLYYYRKKDESKCFDLYSEMSDGEYAVLEDGDYMFFEVEELGEKE